MVNEFVSSGQVLFEYRDLAFLGEDSVQAAGAALCADEQGAFWAFHDGLYYNQVNNAAYNTGAFSRERLDVIAETVGLDMVAFGQCMDEDRYEDQVLDDSAEAQRQGINQTPTFIVNGELVQGVGSYDDIRTQILEALNGSSDAAPTPATP